MTCPWCVDDKCRSDDEKTCDFRTINYDKDSIRQRIEQEMDIVEFALEKLKKTNEQGLIRPAVKDMADRLVGIKVMQDALQKLGFPYKSERNPFRLIILIKQADKHLKKISKEANKDG